MCSTKMTEAIKEKYCYIISEDDSRKMFEISLERLLKKRLKRDQKLIIICIGSDYIVGDCLGPLVGYKLNSRHHGLTVYGDFEDTVHSANLVEILQEINEKYKNPFIIAIDSALCYNNIQIGNVKLRDGGLVPGIAFKKTLPYVGHISITGITNSESSFEKFIQTTRMSLVMRLADFIATGLINTLIKMNLID